MKIISGSLKGRNIDGYDIVGTRPTMARVKESIFSIIQSKVKKAVVLDLFAGSGNYGIEAYSNGAYFVYSNDANKKCFNVIKKNIEKFNINENFNILCMDYMKCLDFLMKKEIKFDLVFLDPPYKMNVCECILDFLSRNKMLNNDALIICEVTNIDIKQKVDKLNLIKSKKYGEKYVLIYQYDI